MIVDYIHCHACGYEDVEVYAAYARTVANGDIYLCPLCGEETMIVEIKKD